jgi:hypothetical protein
VCSSDLAGFYSAYTRLLAKLMPALHREIPAVQRATTPVVVTGHSLGGALATIAAYELSLAGYLVRGVFTFGSPRVGNLVSALEGLAVPALSTHSSILHLCSHPLISRARASISLPLAGFHSGLQHGRGKRQP